MRARRILCNEVNQAMQAENGPVQNRQLQGEEQGNMVVYRTDIGRSRIKARKAELIKLLELEYSYYCPGNRILDLDMLKGVVSGRKALIKKEVVRKV